MPKYKTFQKQILIALILIEEFKNQLEYCPVQPKAEITDNLPILQDAAF
jgi:hypothetical protein